MLLLTLLPACATLSTMTGTDTSTVCAPWRAIPYSSKTKTSIRYAAPDLARDLSVHNFTGSKLCGWKPPVTKK